VKAQGKKEDKPFAFVLGPSKMTSLQTASLSLSYYMDFFWKGLLFK
jgi:hypothetical protein